MVNSGPIKRSSVLLWIGVFLFLFGSAFAFAGWHAIQTEREYESGGRTVQGTILGKRIDESWDTDSKTKKRTKRTSYQVRYSFSPAGLPAIESSSSVSSEVYNSAKDGERIDIQYLAADPQNNRVAHQPEYVVGSVFLGIGGLILLIGAGLSGYEIKARATNSRLMQEGETAEAVVKNVAPGDLSINNIKQWRISYSFSDRMGQTHSAVTPHIPPNKAKEWKAGDKGTVRFDPANPKVNVWVGR